MARKIPWGAIRRHYEDPEKGLETYRSIAERYEISVQGLKAHAKRHGWISPKEFAKKVQKRLEKKQAELTEEAMTEMEMRAEEYRKSIFEAAEMGLNAFKKKLAAGECTPKDFYELEKVANLMRDGAGIEKKEEGNGGNTLNIALLSTPRVVDEIDV